MNRDLHSAPDHRPCAGTIHLLHGGSRFRRDLHSFARERQQTVCVYDRESGGRQTDADGTPGCLIVDYHAFGRQALLDLLAERAGPAPFPPTICTYRHASAEDAKSAMRAGALAFIRQPGEWQELESYIGIAMSLSRLASGRQAMRRASDNVTALISGREEEVLRLIASGLSSRQAAESMNISARTVESHRANMIKKLGLRTTADLLRHFYYFYETVN